MMTAGGGGSGRKSWSPMMTKQTCMPCAKKDMNAAKFVIVGAQLFEASAPPAAVIIGDN